MSLIHNGVRVVDTWPAKIIASQQQTFYTCTGKQYPRIRFGDEDPRWGERPCRDCAVVKGQYHVIDCEYERCPVCNHSLAGCECKLDERFVDEEPDPPSASETRPYRIFVYCFFFVVAVALIRSLLMFFGI